MKSKAELRDKIRRLKHKLAKLEKSKLACERNTAKADLVDMSETVDEWMKLAIDRNHEIGQLKNEINKFQREKTKAIIAYSEILAERNALLQHAGSQLDAAELQEFRAWLVHKNQNVLRVRSDTKIDS